MGSISTIHTATTETIIRRIGDAAVDFIVTHHHLPAAGTEGATRQIKEDLFAVLMGRSRGLDPETRACQSPWIEDVLLDLGTSEPLSASSRRHPEAQHISFSGLVGLPCPTCGSCYDSSLPGCPYCERRLRRETNEQGR